MAVVDGVLDRFAFAVAAPRAFGTASAAARNSSFGERVLHVSSPVLRRKADFGRVTPRGRKSPLSY
jgi:hypothetical protein